ncbi:MAG: HAD-IA family hydrolase [Halothiobacillaceae bacterium]
MSAERRSAIRAVLFDLDGTLVDTAPDLALALNRLRLECNRPPLPFEQIRPQVSNGAAAMVRVGFGLRPGQTGYRELRQRFLHLYLAEICRDSRLFPGLEAVLEELTARNLPWGIVTNKPGFLTTPLLAALALESRVTVCGDTLPVKKPDPAPMHHAAGILKLPPEACLYIGDHERDIVAARAANMPSLGATWGYLDGERAPADWGADALIARPEDVLEWL